jgi:hypothetical protein
MVKRCAVTLRLAKAQRRKEREITQALLIPPATAARLEPGNSKSFFFSDSNPKSIGSRIPG